VSTHTFPSWFRSLHPDIPLAGAEATLKLAGEGATIPFLARYRKEQTGNLDEVAIQKVLEAKERWDSVTARQAFIVEEITRQKKLTPELRAQILSTYEPNLLEDLYLPYKVKRKTKAALAREAGLEPLADWIWNCGHGTDTPQPGQTLELWAFTFRNEEKGFTDVPAVIQGALDILTERLGERPELRQAVREATFAKGVIRARKGDEAKAHSKYERYFDFFEPLKTLLLPQNSHRYLALRRGAAEKELTLSISGPPDDPEHEERLLRRFEAEALSVPDSPGAAVLLKAARLALRVQVLSAIESEVHRALKEVADAAAIHVFAENLRKLLLASPFGAKAVLGVDPGLRTGCKVAAVDDGGRYLSSTVIHVETEEGRAAAKKLLGDVLGQVAVRAIAVGNGTAGREAETFLRAAVRELESKVPVVMVSESGASVYSASEAAREEFPNLDLTVRGAISIARRLQDPLAELVKVDPKSIGVGQYQHDVAPGSLKKSLELVVESCVNQVGVNLNTASYHLLAHVSGIGPALARAIVDHRGRRGLFKARAELLDVPRFSSKAFEQAAGFLRIPGGTHPLDNTGVHPERYPLLEGLAAGLGRPVGDLLGSGVSLVREASTLREEVGSFTFDDIVQELQKPGRDPRDEFVPFQYREDIHELKDLKPGMTCPGIVTNVTNFGAFVDIGVHQDGLVHVSQLSLRFVKDPAEVVHPGMRVEVRVLEVNLDKGQIALSMKTEPPRRAAGVSKKDKGRRRDGGARGPEAPRIPRPERGKGAPPPGARARTGPPPARSAPPPRPPSPAPPRSPQSKPATSAPPPSTAGGPRRPAESRPRPPAPSPRPPAKVPLNNPFAVLADFKKTLKGR
jgi:protein Tex